MALPLAKAAPLRPQVRLAQALSEFEAILTDDQKARFRTYRGQSPPNQTDVIRFTAEIDRDGSRNRKSRQCVGTRLTNVLHAVQQFSTVVDVIVGSSQSQIAGAIWGTVKICIQLASAISTYFDQLSTLFMRIGLTCQRYQDFGLLFPESIRLQSALCEYFVVIVHLCKQAVVFLKKPFWSQLSSSILKPFDSEFGSFHRDLEDWASAIREELSLASNQAQQNEATEMSKFRAFATRKLLDTSTQDLGKTRAWKRKKAELLFLNACSNYDHEKSWKRARKQGNTTWICYDAKYKQWKNQKVSSTLWCTGILGSGKTVLSANVVEDLKITTSAAIAYFFCRYDEVESLQTRTIIGSIARQIFDYIKPDLVDEIAIMGSGTMDTDQILDYIQTLLPPNLHEYFIIIDGLDECKEEESKLLLQCLKQLLMSKTAIRVYCSSRPDVSRWAPALLESQWNVFMSQINPDIEEYINDTLEQRLGSGNLSIGDPKIILTIRDALLENAHGMFLWVAFQINSICAQKTDAAILKALKDLPKDLPETFNRILRKLQHSNTADPHFCEKIFDLMVAAHRPFTLEELREAVSVEPGKMTWDASNLVNDMLKSLLHSCGSLVNIDEERLTVHFAHHSVKQHLLSKPTDSDTKNYHIDSKEADLYMGDVVVTYLNFGIFHQELTKTTPTPMNSTILPHIDNYPSAILGSLSEPNVASRWAMRLLRSKRDSRLDIHVPLKSAAGVVDRPKEPIRSAHPFLLYAQDYWLFHTKLFHLTTKPRFDLWKRLIGGEVETVKLPWAPKKWDDFGDECMEWIIQNKHWALIDQSLEDIVRLLLENGANVNADAGSYGTALQAASRRGHLEIAKLLLNNGAKVDAGGGSYGNSLRVASAKGHEEIVRLLLENGADVNAEGRSFASALQAASTEGHLEIVRLLLENGANVNAEGGSYGNALQAVSTEGHLEIARFLLNNGANVDAEGGPYGNPLQAASRKGHEEIVRLLLENGANVNSQGRYNETPLNAAAGSADEAIVRLLLNEGAIVDSQTMAAASFSQNKEVKKLICNASKLQSS